MKKLFRRIKKESMTKFVNVLPRKYRDRLIRNQVRLDLNPPTNLVFKLAETKDELEQVFSLLYRSYLASGSMKPNDAKMRITPYHALPSTSILIAVQNGRVVATLSVFRISAFGTPATKVFDVTNLLNSGVRFAEISSLTTEPDFRTDNREIIFGLFKYLYEYVSHYFGIDIKLIVIKPFRKFFYESLLLFQDFDKKVVTNYNFSNGATVISQFLNIRTSPQAYKKAYSEYPDEQNLYKYFCETKFSNFIFPERQYNMVSDPVMTPELLSYFFCEKSKLLNDMNDFERNALRMAYPQKDYKLVLSNFPSQGDKRFNRITTRFECECSAQFLPLQSNYIDLKNVYNVQIRNVSETGLLAYLPKNFDHTVKKFKAYVQVGPDKKSEVELEIKWHNGHNLYGFQVTQCDQIWMDFCSHAEKEFYGRTIRKA